jgi:CBS domain-containing protein
MSLKFQVGSSISRFARSSFAHPKSSINTSRVTRFATNSNVGYEIINLRAKSHISHLTRSYSKSVSSLFRELDTGNNRNGVVAASEPDEAVDILNPNNVNMNNESTLPPSAQVYNVNSDLEYLSSPQGVSGARTKLRVADIIKSIEDKEFNISQQASISDAINHLVAAKLSSALVIAADGAVAGIFTARDLLKCINENSATGAQSKSLVDYLKNTKISEIMTKREKLVYCSPSDSLNRCREIMFQCKIRNLPVIDPESYTVKGILTMKILADSSFNLMETGGKKGFIHNVTGRRGLPNSAKIDLILSDALNNKSKSQSGSPSIKLDIEIGAFALPHPYKNENGVSNTRRDYGAFELSTDLRYCEDAHFAVRLKDTVLSNPLDIVNNDGSIADAAQVASHLQLPLSVVNEPSQVFMCVADGVGSWRGYGLDPREYSHRYVPLQLRIMLILC